MPEGNVFEGLNQRLLGLGIPRWNAGSYVVEPIVSVGFLLAFILLGIRGLLFAGLLFLLSQSTLGGGQGIRGWLGGGGDQGRRDDPDSRGGGGGSSYQLPPGGGGGGGGSGGGGRGSGGYRLGNS